MKKALLVGTLGGALLVAGTASALDIPVLWYSNSTTSTIAAKIAGNTITTIAPAVTAGTPVKTTVMLSQFASAVKNYCSNPSNCEVDYFNGQGGQIAKVVLNIGTNLPPSAHITSADLMDNSYKVSVNGQDISSYTGNVLFETIDIESANSK